MCVGTTSIRLVNDARATLSDGRAQIEASARSDEYAEVILVWETQWIERQRCSARRGLFVKRGREHSAKDLEASGRSTNAAHNAEVLAEVQAERPGQRSDSFSLRQRCLNSSAVS